MLRDKRLQRIGLGNLPDNYFDDKDGRGYRFYIAEDVVRAGACESIRCDESGWDAIAELYEGVDTVALYVHVPWCVEECTYCYYWGKVDTRREMARLLKAEQKHAETLDEAFALSNKKVPSIYFGGGTPTVLPPDLLEDCLAFYAGRYASVGETEVSCEASVSSLSEAKIEILKKYATRLSIGVQTFNDRILEMVARTFSRSKAIELLKELKRHFKYINIDLIYGMQTQTLRDWLQTVETAINIGVTSITLYRLEIRDGPKLIKTYLENPEEFPTEIDCREMHGAAKDMLQSAGYKENLVGWFLKPEVEDTVVYRERWQKQTPCVAFGPGVQNYGADYFYYNVIDRLDYIDRVERKAPTTNTICKMDRKQQMLWYVMAQFKSNAAVKSSELAARFGAESLNDFHRLIKDFVDWKVLTASGGETKMTEGGKSILEWILRDMIRSALGGSNDYGGVFNIAPAVRKG